MGVGCEADINVKDLLVEAQKYWNIYHLIIQPVTGQPVIADWRSLLSERAVVVRNIDKLAEVIATIITINEGHDHNKVMDDFDDEAKNTVRDATQRLLTGSGV